MGDFHDLRNSLTTRLETLTHRVKGYENTLRNTDGLPTGDFEDRATLIEDDEVVERLEDSGRKEIQAIHNVLARMDAGTYGLCEGCGDRIPPGRLRAMPYARTCVGCAS